MNAKDIVEKSFETVRKGYSIEEVDRFLRDVSVEYLNLQNENEELEKKLEILADKIKEYRKDEDALREALLIAKKQGIAVVNEAKEDAERIVKEAKEKAEKILREASEEGSKRKAQTNKDIAAAQEKAKAIIAEAYAMAERTILENREGLTALAELLLEREVVFTEDVERILGKRDGAEPVTEPAAEPENA